MSTVENQMYGSGWSKCTHCGVKDRDQELELKVQRPDPVHVITIKTLQHKNEKLCAEWKATLDGVRALKLSNVKAGTLAEIDAFLAEVHDGLGAK